MTLAKRIIPCLDVANGRVVKGVQFVDLVDAGDPVELAAVYAREGADELVVLDITASHEARGTLIDLVERVSDALTIPCTIGGGVRTREDLRALLHAGADKVTVNTAAILHPPLIDDLAAVSGAQCVVVAIDVKWTGAHYEVFTHGGRTATGREAIAWAREVCARGAGELMITSMDRDGGKLGYDCRVLRAISEAVNVPIIASGGAGTLPHFFEALRDGNADAVLAASVFHFGTFRINDVKKYLHTEGVEVRWNPHSNN